MKITVMVAMAAMVGIMNARAEEKVVVTERLRTVDDLHSSANICFTNIFITGPARPLRR